MITDLNDIYKIIFPFTISFFIFYFLSKRYFKSVFDPYFYGLVVYFSTSSTLMYIVNFDKDFYFFNYIVLNLSFFAGLRFASLRLYSSTKEVKSDTINSCARKIFRKSNVKRFSNFTLFLFGIALLVQLIIFFKYGFAIASDNPSEAKSSMYDGGGGIIRRFLWTVMPYMTICVILMLFVGYRRKLYLFILFLTITMLILSGSKSALLPVIFVISLLAFHYLFFDEKIIRKIYKILPVIFILAIAVALSVLSQESDGNLSIAIFKLVNRLLFNGDVVLYYYDPSVYQYFKDFNFFDFISHIFNGPLGMLRLVPYELPHGYTMVNIYNGGVLPFDSILGPNTPVYIIADIYFGHYFGWLYSFLLGGVFGYLRRIFVSYKGGNIFVFSFLIFLIISSFQLIVEVSLFFSTIFEFVIFVLPIFITYYFIRFTQGLTLRVVI